MKVGSLENYASPPLTFLDGVREQFEAACKAAGASGVMPSPESFLEQAPESLKPELLCVLSACELDYRRLRLELSKKMKWLSEKLNPLRILDCIGKGGMGDVFKGQDTSGQIVAVKVLPEEFGQDNERIARFEREARVLAQIRHENIIALLPIPHFDDGTGLSYFMDQRDGLAYFVMEFAEGGNLRARIGENGVSPTAAIGMILQVCQGLQHAHDAGVVHRDLKPENILIDSQGRLKIADFGLVKISGSSQTKTSHTMGTPPYMAPEQARETSKVDRRADIYSLGVIFYELLTGRRPPQEKQVDPMFMKGRAEDWLQGVVLRALAQNPNDRFQEVGEMSNAIQLGPFMAEPLQYNEQSRLFG